METVPFPHPPLVDDVIRLRAWAAADVEVTHRATQDPDIARFTRVPANQTRDDVRAFIESREPARMRGETLSLVIAACDDDVRAHMLLGILDAYLLRLARLQHNALTHWATPSQALEHELPPDAVHRYRKCTASADPTELETALLVTWEWGQELITALAEHDQFAAPTEVIAAASERTTRLTKCHQPRRR